MHQAEKLGIMPISILDRVKINSVNEAEKPAIIENSGSESSSISWGRLDECSDKLASYLKRTLKSNTPIIVYGHKNPYMIVCFLAAVKSGRAYCPIDTSLPGDRIKAIVEAVNPEIILSVFDIPLKLSNIISLEEIIEICNKEEIRISSSDYVKPDDLFYIIFTSGSTGVPKGVKITLNCLDNFLNWITGIGTQNHCNKPMVYLNQAPFSFDLSVLDLYSSLYTGGTLWCLTKDVQQNAKELYKSLQDSNITKWVSTPSFAEMCLGDPMFSERLMPNIEDFYFCGEVLTKKTSGRLLERFPNGKVFNLYGPTESTCAVTSVEITKSLLNEEDILPVGRPKSGTYLEILGENGDVMAEGQSGEIVIIGDTVGTGYWSMGELTSKKFGVTEIDGIPYRFYRTGDKGYLQDGLLFYNGRIDLQVKLHGYRIEIEDIEANLRKIDGIESAVVIPKMKESKVSFLIACVVSNCRGDDYNSEEKRIKGELKKYLPSYMIPKRIRFFDELPTNNNGKIDRKDMERQI